MELFIVFSIVTLTVSAAPSPCNQVSNCTCGKTRETFLVCTRGSNLQDVCSRWSSCKSCRDWVERCYECPDGFEGPFCKQGSRVGLFSQIAAAIGNRQKRQVSTHGRVTGGTSEVFCFNPGTISLGRVVVDTRTSATMDDQEFPEGTQLKFYCNTGYILEGANSLTCTEYGMWSADLPRCRRELRSTTLLSCSDPDSIPNGNVKAYIPRTAVRSDPDEYPSGTRLEYTCKSDYKLSGSPMLHCRSSGTWSNPKPVCEADCGQSFVKTEVKVINGNITKLGEWPWMVALWRSPDSGVICGGALINPTTVVTAAHCLTQSDRFILYFGKLYSGNENDDDEVQVRNSSRIIIHPNFNRDFTTTDFDSDIGLIMFEPSVHFTKRIHPICLPSADTTTENLISANRGYVTGWGITENRMRSNLLMLAHIPLVTNTECIESYSMHMNISLHLTQNQYCAGNKNGHQSLCNVDSGSPMTFYDQRKDRYTMEGLVSFGVYGQCGMPGRYTVFTNMYKFVPWIKCTILQKKCIYFPR